MSASYSYQGWKCPKCGSENLGVTVELECLLEQTEFTNPEGYVGNDYHVEPPFSGNGGMTKTSPMSCHNCGYQATVEAFEWIKGPEGSITATAEVAICDDLTPQSSLNVSYMTH